MLYFFAVGVLELIGHIVQLHAFNLVGQSVTFNLRRDLFSKLLHKTMRFFDKKQNNPGFLASKLGSDCLTVNSIVSICVGAIIQGIGALSVGLATTFYFSWRLGLIGIVACPWIIMSALIETKMAMQGSTTHDENGELELDPDVKIF